MKDKKFLYAAILFLVVGFAAVSTVLYINGSLGITTNDDDLDVYFSEARIDGEVDNSVIISDKQIVFTKEFSKVGDTYTLEYDITNGSKNYDADVSISCTSGNEYVSIDNTWTNSTIIESTETQTGTLKAEMIKGYTGNEFELSVECEISANAIERDSQGSGEVASKIDTDNSYNLTGTLIDVDGNAVNGGTIAVLSEPHIVEVGTDGTFKIEDLESGRHHMYYFKDLTIEEVTALNLEDKTESEINKLTTLTSIATFTTTDIKVNLSDGYKINDYKNEFIPKTFNLYEMIKSNASSETIDFSVNSGTSRTNGIYTTSETDSGRPVYYYRGSYTALNNNLIFNNMCWKIIRTTETGGIKLIYNGTPTDGKCETQTGDATQVGISAFNTNYNDNAYVGYMYGTAGKRTYEVTHANINDSTIKIYIDNWYTTNFDADATAKLEDTVFCNDRSTKAYDATTIGATNFSSYGALGYEANTTLYGAAHRAWYYTITPSPSLKCTNENDKFTVSTSNGNGKLTNPVGLITLDETVLAGFNTYASNTSNYTDVTNFLYTNSDYWTFSPVYMGAGGGAFVGSVYSTGSVGNGNVRSIRCVRPVVSLVVGTLATGDGSTTNPYVVQ